MKKIYLIIFLLGCFSISYGQLLHERLQIDSELTYQEIVDSTESYFLINGKGKGQGYKQFQVWKYWSGRALDNKGFVVSSAKSLKSHNQFRQSNVTTTKNLTTNYTEMGPLSQTNTSTWSSGLGRVSAIGLDPNDQQHIIVGAPSGGIWKTTDYGSNWTPLFDDQALIDVFSLEISPTNSNVYLAGLWPGFVKSNDGGANWFQPLGISQNGYYNTIEVHPLNTNHVFAIDQLGDLYKSIDGGENFYVVINSNERFYDLEFHPTNPNIIYISGNDAIYKSVDGGENFSEITTGPWSGSGNTIMMAVTAAAVDNIYALEEVSGGFNAVYLSQNGGTSWSTLSNNSCGCNNIMGYDQNAGGGQAPRDMDIIVSPTDPTTIHVAGVETWRSLNNGQSWTKTTNWSSPGGSNFIHADIDLLIHEGNRIVAGTDGGIYYSTDEGSSWTDISSGLGIRQFYRIGASETATDRVSGGSQDNGTGVVKQGVWYDYLGADGMETFIDWSNADILYGTSQYGNLYKSLDGGNTRLNLPRPGPSGNWVTPFEQDPINSSVVYTASDDVYKSLNGGSSWSRISSFGRGDRADEMKIAPTDNNRIYVAYDGILFVTSNGGSTWSSTSLTGNVNYIAVDPFNADRLTLVFNSGNRLQESIDGGLTFTNITGNIPSNIPLECATYEDSQNGGLYVGGYPGVYHTSNSSSLLWTEVSINMPTVRVTELEIRNQTLYVATYGRGLWKNSISCDGSNAGQPCDDFDACTINDVFDGNCNCVGVFQDADGDGVCDNDDICPLGDDNADLDNDGIPDACDNCNTVTDQFPVSSLAHSGTGSSSTTFTVPGSPTSGASFTISNINQRLNGKTSNRFIDLVEVSYVNSTGSNIVFGTYSGANLSSVNIVIADLLTSITVQLSDDYDGNGPNMSVSLGQVEYCSDPCDDTDGDGVCDENDLCPGFDDNIDVDQDGIPDGCDECISTLVSFSPDPLTHSGTGSSTSSLSLTNAQDISFTVTNLNSKTNGNPGNRFIDVVEVEYVDGNGSTIVYGTFLGDQQSTIDVDITGDVSSISISLSDGYDGNSPNISIDLPLVDYCPVNTPQAPGAEQSIFEQKPFNPQVFPNPVKDILVVDVHDHSSSIIFYNLFGQFVKGDFIGEGRSEVNLSDLNSGIYFIVIMSEGQTVTKKIVKQ